MKKEIGGYFELEHFDGKSFHENGIALNSGRGCLSYLTELRQIKTIWIPDFMCDSVSNCFKRDGVFVHEYSITEDFLPNYNEIIFDSDSWLYLMDYYGTIEEDIVNQAYSFSQGRLIVDETHAYYNQPWSNADTLYTCRKWFGVSDGAYLYTKDNSILKRSLPNDYSYERMEYMLGRFELSANEFFRQAQDNNDFFDDQPAKTMSRITANLLRAIDYKSVAKKRFRNWEILNKNLSGVNKLKLNQPKTAPFMYPLLLENADGVRSMLADMRIYVPTLWPNVAQKNDGSVACNFAKNILPLPIDQRYEEEDMKLILEALRVCLN